MKIRPNRTRSSKVSPIRKIAPNQVPETSGCPDPVPSLARLDQSATAAMIAVDTSTRRTMVRLSIAVSEAGAARRSAVQRGAESVEECVGQLAQARQLRSQVETLMRREPAAMNGNAARQLSSGDDTGAANAASEVASQVVQAQLKSDGQLEAARVELSRARLAAERVLEAEEVAVIATEVAANQQALAIGAVAQATSIQVAIDELESSARSRRIETIQVGSGPVDVTGGTGSIPVGAAVTDVTVDIDSSMNEELRLASAAVLLATTRAAAAAEQAKSLLEEATSRAARLVAERVRVAAVAEQCRAAGDAVKVAAAASEAADLVIAARVEGNEVEDAYKAATIAATVAAAALATAENTAHRAEEVAAAASAAATAAAAIAADAAMALELEVTTAAAEVKADVHARRSARQVNSV